MTTPFFEIRDMNYIYEDGTHALKSINLRIEQGKKIAMLGSNGAGKSTLFLHLNGLLKPSSGMIIYNGVPLKYSKKQLLTLRRDVGIVFQNPETQLFNGTVRDDIAYGPSNLNLLESEKIRLIQKAIAKTDVETLLDKPVHFLSIGQKKRVSIAGVLAMDPNVILFDEPTASLDFYYTKKVLQILNELHSEKKTVIVSTHNIEFAYEWADEVIVMHQGEVLYHGSVPQLFEFHMDIVKKANLDTPWAFDIGRILKMQGVIQSLDAYRSKEKMIYEMKNYNTKQTCLDDMN